MYYPSKPSDLSGVIADFKFDIFVQFSSALKPRGVRSPSPVTTTLFFAVNILWDKIMSQKKKL